MNIDVISIILFDNSVSYAMLIFMMINYINILNEPNRFICHY